jgi:uncharacterized membrane protein
VREKIVKKDAFVDALDDERIVAAIREAESRTRGEIRVHVAKRPVEDVQAEGARVFETLGMTATAERNGVLLFVAPASRRFAVLGDRAIHERCGDGFWKDVADAMAAEFRNGRFSEGILAGIAAVAAELARHFPRRPGDVDRNELPDTVSRG